MPRLREAWGPTSPGPASTRQGRAAHGGSTSVRQPTGASGEERRREEFWQKMEDSELKLMKDSWRREQFLRKDVVEQVDALKDSSLYDLKVNHNSAQRARSVAMPTPPSSAPSGSGRPQTMGSSSQSGGPSRGRESAKVVARAEGAPQRMRDLREAFGSSQFDTASAFGISLKQLDDTRMLGAADRLTVVPGDSPPSGVSVFVGGFGRQMTLGAAMSTEKQKGAGRVMLLQPPTSDRSRSSFNDGLKEILRKTRVDFSTQVMPLKRVK